MNYNKLDLVFNGGYGQQHNVYCLNLPIVTPSKKIYNTYRAGGRSGEMLEDTKQRTNATVDVTLTIINDHKQTEIDLRRWLTGTGKLSFTNEQDYFYKVLKVEVSSLHMISSNVYTVDVEFTVYPYKFAQNSDVAVKLQRGQVNFYNPYDEATPTYIIEGEGMATLHINDKEITVNVGQLVMIDTFLMMAYKGAKLKNNTIQGDFSQLKLNRGINTIFLTSGFTLSIIPHWGWTL